jgi:O-methyltransferase
MLGIGALADLALAAHNSERKEIPGLFIEAGSALGGSSILLTAAKKADRPLWIYDTFEMIPSPSSEDGKDAHDRYQIIQGRQARGIKEDLYYGYVENLIERVKQSFEKSGYPVEKNNVQMIKGLIENTMEICQPVALAHIDCDWYSPVMACLENITPNLSPGGRIIIDDYEQWSGARKAVDYYFAGKKDAYQFLTFSRLHIIKKAG